MKLKVHKKVLLLLFLLIFVGSLIMQFTNTHGETEDLLNSKDLIVKFYEMGDGDCTFIKYGNLEILIDGGENKGKLDHVKNELI